MPFALLIPAFQPGEKLVSLVESLAGSEFTVIVVVDDGSGPEYQHIFDKLLLFDPVRVIRHAVNLGKGAALKTGMNYALVEFPALTGIVTADADGQHDPADIRSVARRLAEMPHALVLGAREFVRAGGSAQRDPVQHIPLRSRFGNSITSAVMRFVVGQRLSDTQTGLRAVPRSLAERMLSVPASGYDFELEMLVAAKHLDVPLIEQPIRTIYEPGNPSSHFEPLRDSMRIYFVLLRFGFISMITAGLDNLLFYLLFHATGVVAPSLFGARAVSLTFNYLAVRRAVFLSRAQHRVVLPRFLLLGAANVCLSYGLITFSTGVLLLPVIPSKIVVESFLFIANFAIQRDFIFVRPSFGTAATSRP